MKTFAVTFLGVRMGKKTGGPCCPPVAGLLEKKELPLPWCPGGERRKTLGFLMEVLTLKCTSRLWKHLGF